MSQTFAEVPLITAQLQGDLAQLPPLNQCLHTPVLLAALAALQPEITTEQILAAWPPGSTVCDMWTALLANLGFTVQPVAGAVSSRTMQTWVSNKGDILVWPAGNAKATWVWSAQERTVISPPRDLSTGHLFAIDETEAPEGSDLLHLVMRRYRRAIAPLLVASLLIQSLGVLVPVFIMVVYDHVIDGRAPAGYTGLLIGLGMVLTVEGTLRGLRSRMLARLGVKACTLVANLVTGKLLHFPTALIERASISSQLSRLRGLEIIREAGTSPLVLGLLDVPFVAVVLTMLAIIGGNLVWVPLALVGTYALLMVLLLPWVRSVLSAQSRNHESRQNMVLEACQYVVQLRADGLSEFWLERLARTGHEAALSNQTGANQQHMLDVMAQVGSSLAGLGTLAVGVNLVNNGTLTAGALVAAMMLVWRIMAPLALVCTSLPRLMQLQQTFLQLQKLFDIPTETSPLAVQPVTHLGPANLRGEVAFHHVTLRYNSEHGVVLNNLTFHLRAGQMMTVSGHNGTGKSSVLKLLMGLYQPQNGSIRLDGIDLRQWNPERLRTHVAYLPQLPELFSATIATNLRLTNPTASDNQLWQSLEQSGAADTVRMLNDGLNHSFHPQTEPSDLLHYQLSLARLFLHPGRLVLCDELPAHIMNGPVGEALCRWLAGRRGNITVIAASSHHRLLEMADHGVGLRSEATALSGKPERVIQALQHQALSGERLSHAA
jgi:ABC-type bacteriocin/lantibiotic exporter with double-glycine peptidase domain